MKQSATQTSVTTLSLLVMLILGGLYVVSPAEEADPVFTSLYVQGDNVNVRADADGKSAVLKRMNTGENCDIVERGKVETIGGKQDFWYRIKLYDVKASKTGWVFGAFTSLRQGGRIKLVMVFDGCRADSNNFSHKLFRDQSGKQWDFSDTGHNFGEYELCAEGKNIEGNPTEVGKKEYVGKKFEVSVNNLTFRPSCLWSPEECSKLKAESRPSVIFLRMIK